MPSRPCDRRIASSNFKMPIAMLNVDRCRGRVGDQDEWYHGSAPENNSELPLEVVFNFSQQDVKHRHKP